ncbi:hypothetical protein, partial [Rhodoblastus sp.]|uniref:hypothetical protein n=1 Tax=Rhodoblastus sp. TaxID=1962975 RepID=UPI003F9C889E
TRWLKGWMRLEAYRVKSGKNNELVRIMNSVRKDVATLSQQTVDQRSWGLSRGSHSGRTLMGLEAPPNGSACPTFAR